jgi:hypothetical protein
MIEIIRDSETNLPIQIQYPNLTDSSTGLPVIVDIPEDLQHDLYAARAKREEDIMEEIMAKRVGFYNAMVEISKCLKESIDDAIPEVKDNVYQLFEKD